MAEGYMKWVSGYRVRSIEIGKQKRAQRKRKQP